MTKQEHFIWDQIFRGAMKAGVKERQARDQAIQGVEDYRKGNFNPRGLKKINCGAVDLIEQRIAIAKKLKE